MAEERRGGLPLEYTSVSSLCKGLWSERSGPVDRILLAVTSIAASGLRWMNVPMKTPPCPLLFTSSYHLLCNQLCMLNNLTSILPSTAQLLHKSLCLSLSLDCVFGLIFLPPWIFVFACRICFRVCLQNPWWSFCTGSLKCGPNTMGGWEPVKT